MFALRILASLWLGLLPWTVAYRARSEGLAFVLFFASIGSYLWLMALGNFLMIRARRGPAIQACREGLLVRITQSSEVPEIPSAYGPFGMVLDLLFTREARLPVARVPWENIAAIGVARPRGRLALIVQVVSDRRKGETFFLVVSQSELAASVRRVAVSLNTFFHHPDRRASLSAWDDADGELRPFFTIS